MQNINHKLAKAYYKAALLPYGSRYFVVSADNTYDAALVISGHTPWGRAAVTKVVKSSILGDHPSAKFTELDRLAFEDLPVEKAQIKTAGMGYILICLGQTVEELAQ